MGLALTEDQTQECFKGTGFDGLYENLGNSNVNILTRLFPCVLQSLLVEGLKNVHNYYFLLRDI
jgi:hypothetical protein